MVLRVMRFTNPTANQGANELVGIFRTEVFLITLVESHGLPREIKERDAHYVNCRGKKYEVRDDQIMLPYGVEPDREWEAVGDDSVMGKALATIVFARDFHAEHGHYPSGTVTAGQEFDDWAADVAEKALRKGK